MARLPASGVLPAIALAAGLVFPLVANNYWLHVANYSLIYLLPALGLNLIFGYVGLLSLAQGAFFGLGAYSCALMSLHFGWPFPATIAFAAAFCAGIALLLAGPSLRLRAYSFVMATLGFVFVAEAVAKNWIALTRGDMALTGIPRPSLAFLGIDLTLQALWHYYVLLLALAVAGSAFFLWLVRSPAGRLLVAIRDEEMLARSYGIRVDFHKAIAFAISAAFAGAGGAAYAMYETVVSPQIFQLYFTLLFLVIVFAGGAGTFSGVVIGTGLFVSIPEALRIAPDLRMLLYGIVFLVFVFWLPRGIGPAVRRLHLARIAAGREADR
ncbi:MAG: branched-chain amino acid ABC transporter permease [Lautropia sp.]